MLYPIRVEGSSDAFLIRLPLPNQAVFPEEKTISEVATMACITQHTQLLVPKIFHHGVDDELGPYMIIQDLGSRRGMGRAVETPRKDSNETPVLNPNISESKLKDAYFQMGQCLLQFAQPTFPSIGALAETTKEFYSVAGRPYTQKMNNMVKLSNIPKSIFPSESTTYQTADDLYVALTDMQIATLIFQHNDMVTSEDDCKTRYVARQLFRKLAKQGRLSKLGFSDDNWSACSKHNRARLPAPDSPGSFRLWGDDVRPNNVLIDDNDQILGAIDSEFSYAAPTQFILDPPWWLLLDQPELWDAGIDDWASNYERRLKTWLVALEEAEQAMGPGSLLSAHTGRFRLNTAARKSWAFDTVSWKYLDKRFFGKREEGIPWEEM